jgi:hypothetical protein
VDLKDKIREELRNSYGDFNTYLEHRYEETIIKKLSEGNLNRRFDYDNMIIKKAWVTYNQVIIELKDNLKDMLRVKELQYRLTNSENPNEVCIEVIKTLDKRSPELERLYEKIINFIS